MISIMTMPKKFLRTKVWNLFVNWNVCFKKWSLYFYSQRDHKTKMSFIFYRIARNDSPWKAMLVKQNTTDYSFGHETLWFLDAQNAFRFQKSTQIYIYKFFLELMCFYNNNNKNYWFDQSSLASLFFFFWHEFWGYEFQLPMHDFNIKNKKITHKKEKITN